MKGMEACMSRPADVQLGRPAVRLSAVEELISSRIASMRRCIFAESEVIRMRAMRNATDGVEIGPPTAAERASLNFITWVRSREPGFFMNAPPVRAGFCSAVRQEYERKLLAFGREWQRNGGDRGDARESQELLLR
jgi:hypothetical protein